MKILEVSMFIHLVTLINVSEKETLRLEESPKVFKPWMPIFDDHYR